MKKKILVITGANKGIGFATVKKFIEKNWYVRACVRNVSSKLKSLIKNNGEIFNIELNSEDSVKSCAKTILSKFEKVDSFRKQSNITILAFGKFS